VDINSTNQGHKILEIMDKIEGVRSGKYFRQSLALRVVFPDRNSGRFTGSPHVISAMTYIMTWSNINSGIIPGFHRWSLAYLRAIAEMLKEVRIHRLGESDRSDIFLSCRYFIGSNDIEHDQDKIYTFDDLESVQ
jgi:hypothetical protein